MVKDPRQDIIESTPRLARGLKPATQFGLHPEQVRRVVRSTQGSFQLEQLLRDRARSMSPQARFPHPIAPSTNGPPSSIVAKNAFSLAAVTMIPSLSGADLASRDVVNALAWATHHMRELTDASLQALTSPTMT